MNPARHIPAVLASLTLMAVVAGCSSQEPVTNPTYNREQPSIDDLRATTDVMAESLAADLNNLIDNDFGDTRVVLFLGDIANNTGTVPTGDFNLIRRRIKTKLMKNDTFRDNVQVRETSSRVRDLSSKERSGGGSDPFGQGGVGVGGADDVDPDFVFFLNGNAERTARRGESQFYVDFELMRESNGELVWNEGYEIRYGNR